MIEMGLERGHFLDDPRGRQSLQAEFTAVATLLSVAFTDTSRDALGRAITSYLWAFGDGETSTDQNPTHAYATVGTKIVRLTVSTADGSSAVIEHPVAVDITRDGPLRWRVPLSAAAWTAIGLPTPWLQPDCQVASGDLTPIVGSISFPGSGAGRVYRRSVAGWTTLFCGTEDAATGEGWRTTDVTLNFAGGESIARLSYVAIANPTNVERRFHALQENQRSNAWRLMPGGYLEVIVRDRTARSTGSYSDGARVRSLLWYRDCAASLMGGLTDADALVSTPFDGSQYGGNLPGVAGSLAKSIGARGSTSAPPFTRTCLDAWWRGADAETIARRETLEALGIALAY